MVGYAVREDARGAWIKGTRVRKTVTIGDDAHAIGARATIVGSMAADSSLGYWVEFDDAADLFIFVRADRIEPIETDGPEVAIDKREKCDFCVEDPRFKPVRVFRCFDFIVPDKANRKPQVLMTGGWASCSACASLIDREMWDDLLLRTVDLYCEKHRIVELDFRSQIRQAISWSHSLFRAYRVKT